jgi:hypothetical protein
MNRQPGYYWVKYEGEWVIAQWWYDKFFKKHSWQLGDIEMDHSDFEEIDEKRIERHTEPAAHRLGYTPDQL